MKKRVSTPSGMPHLNHHLPRSSTPFRSLLTIPAACGSFIFFHMVKSVLQKLRNARNRGGESLYWRPLSEALAQPLALPYIMVAAPRWNPHALIANVGPFQLQERLRVRVDTAHRSAQMWTLVIYTDADSRTIAAIDSRNVAPEDFWYEQALPPGRYHGVLRYYEWAANPRLPALEIDGHRHVPERGISARENDYLAHLRDKHGAFYTSLNYYTVEMLRFRHYLPESFIRREYLPVGNPETAFAYGYLRQDQCIELTSRQGIPEGFNLYLTIYNRASFPVIWSTVEALPYRSPPAESTGSYLLRLHAQGTATIPPVWPEHLLVTIS